MSKFTLIHETPNHFVLYNGKAHFHVAKKGLAEPTADKIRSFANGGKTVAGDITQSENKKNMAKIDANIEAAKHYADGGTTQSPEEAKIEADEKQRRKEEKENPTDYVRYNNPDKYAAGGELDANARKHIAPKNFAGPDKSYPIEDASHARNALARVSQHGSPELQAQVRAKVHAKYPGIEQSKADGGKVETVSDDLDMYKHKMDVTSPKDQKQYESIKQISKETGLPKFDDGGAVQSVQDSFRKATHYKDGGTIREQNPGVQESVEQGFNKPSPPTQEEKDREARYAAIREKNSQQAVSGEYDNGPIKSYAKGGHVHNNAGKNQLHFHFYDGAVVPTQLDKEEGAGPQQASPLDKYVGGEPNNGTPLDNYVNLAEPEGTVGEEAASQGVTLNANDINPNAVINTPGPTPLQQQINQAQAEQNPSPEQSANNLSSSMGQAAPFPTNDPNAVAATVPPSQQVPVAKVPPTPPGMNLTEQLATADKQQKDAVQQGADAQANYWDSQKKILTNQMVDQQQRFDTYQNVQQADQNRLETLFKGVADSKIDPNRYWDNVKTGGKISASIGLILSGIGSGLTGQPNAALNNLNQHIANDIMAQKNDQSNAMNMYKLGLEKYHDDQAAFNFATLNANAMTAGLLQKAAATAGSAQAKAAALNGIAQLTKQSIPLQQSLAMHQVAMQMSGGGSGTKDINPEALPDEMRDRAVRLPNGNLGLSPTKEDAALARKSFTSLSSMDSQLNQFLDTMKKIGPTVNPWGADAATSEAARQNIVLELNNLHGLNRLNDNEFKTYMSMVPTGGTWRPNRATAQIMALKQLVKNKQENEMVNNIEGYKAPKLTPLPAK